MQATNVWSWASQRGSFGERGQNLPCQQSSASCTLTDNLNFVNVLSRRMAEGVAPERAASQPLAGEACPMASAKSGLQKSPWWPAIKVI